MLFTAIAGTVVILPFALQGAPFGHVDLGDLGVADRWADLAVATLSLSWNYAGDWEDDLFDAYGVEPDPERVDFYRALWNAGEVSSH